MRWLLWSGIGLVLLLALWVGSFVAVFDLGPQWYWYLDGAGRYSSGGPAPRGWWSGDHQLADVTEHFSMIWRPLIVVWCRRRGYDLPAREAWVSRSRFLSPPSGKPP